MMYIFLYLREYMRFIIIYMQILLEDKNDNIFLLLI